MTEQLLSYAEAKRQANRKNADKVFRSDAGDGWVAEVVWCSRRKRQCWTSINPAGDRIV